MGKKFKCSGIGRKKKSGKKEKKSAVVDDLAEEDHVPPQAFPREPCEDETFVPSDVVNNLLLKSMEERREHILADEDRIRQ